MYNYIPKIWPSEGHHWSSNGWLSPQNNCMLIRNMYMNDIYISHGVICPDECESVSARPKCEEIPPNFDL